MLPITRYVSLVAIATLAGCAWYEITPTNPANLEPHSWGKSYDEEGYIIHAPAPYLLVTQVEDSAKKTKTLSGQILYLPDPSRPYRVTTGNFLAKADFNFQFGDGWRLEGLTDKSDNTGIASALIEAAAATISPTGTTPAASLVPGLYKIDVANGKLDKVTIK